ncbi:MAG: peptidase C1 [Bacteroidetes bacterium]|nr:MAG: peptidase C1 [Bacteroidota bacterium]
MPIRMEKDEPRRERPRRPGESRQRGSSGLMRLLPLVLMFVLKRPKLIVPLLLVGAAWYFFFGGAEMLQGPAVEDESAFQQQFSFGAEFSTEKYDSAEVFEPLVVGASYSESRLPRAVSMLRYAPQRRHQGRQGSCVGWASSYAARTILEAMATGADPDRVAFSPSFVYNQIALSGCQGAYMLDAMQTLQRVGDLPLSEFGYDERTCRIRPDYEDQRRAKQYRIKGYNRLTRGANNYEPDLLAIKEHLAQGAPVVIGMQVGGTFMHQMRGKALWQPTQRDYDMYGYSGHAMCVIGYDDDKYGGAFQIMNSWGQDWGDRGVAWVRYDDFAYFVKEAYGIYPMGQSPKFDPNKIEAKFGLVDQATQELIPLRQVQDGLFRTRKPIRIGDKFKVAITNTVECYVYVLGEETDGSSYVLFPYTPKHSPYCGITGTRVFPRDYSMVADDVGERDRVAFIVSKERLDHERLNALVNNSRQRSFAAKIDDALGSLRVPTVQFAEQGGAVRFVANTSDRQHIVRVVLEIDKW